MYVVNIDDSSDEEKQLLDELQKKSAFLFGNLLEHWENDNSSKSGKSE